MTLYQSARLFHVLIAILGVGQVVAMAVIASAARSEATVPPWACRALQRLAHWNTASLALMLLTAGVMEYAAGGGYHQALWFRARSLTAGTLLQVKRSSLTMCAVIGVIVVLMELKPG